MEPDGLTYSDSLTIESAKRLNVPQELELIRAAFARNPSSDLMRGRLASLLALSDQFDETVELLEGQSDLSYPEHMLLIRALLAAETAPANRRVCEVARHAADIAPDAEAAAAALADLAKAQIRLDDAAARSTLEQALALDPANKNACKRLAAWLFANDDAQAVLEFTRGLSKRGADHSRQFSAQIMALARLGRIEDARMLEGRGALGMSRILSPPPGWETIEAFNAELARQLLNHSGLRYERYGTASELTWRVDTPNTPDAPLVSALLAQIRLEIDRHVASLDGLEHPWLMARPDRGTLHCWCVITDGAGFETWHVHQFGWMSGVYYVAMPDAQELPDEYAGSLAFGLPPERVGEKAASEFGLEAIRPVSGEMRVFPSHCYHRTYPHQSSSRRICIAFDVWPD